MTFKKFNKQVLSKANLEEPQDVLRVINTLQNNIENSFNPIVSNIQNDSTILQNIQLLAGQNTTGGGVALDLQISLDGINWTDYIPTPTLASQFVIQDSNININVI